MQRSLLANEVSELTLYRSSPLAPIPIGYLTVIPGVHIGYEMVDSQRGGVVLSWLLSSHIQQVRMEQLFY